VTSHFLPINQQADDLSRPFGLRWWGGKL